MARKDSLGKGLSSFLSDTDISLLADSGINVTELPIDKIYPNPYQPRKDFVEEGMENLIASIKSSGIIQPILVRPRRDSFEIVSGERRFRAAVRLKKPTIPAIIRDVPDGEMVITSLIENLQREDLNPVEIAEGIERLLEKFPMTHEVVAERIGMERATVTNLLRILKLPGEVKEGLRKLDISLGHAKVLLSLGDPSLITGLYRRCVKEGLSVRELEKRIDRFKKHRRPERRGETSPQKEYEERLAYILKTEVKITPSRGGKGRIVVRYSSTDELERILSCLFSIKE